MNGITTSGLRTSHYALMSLCCSIHTRLNSGPIMPTLKTSSAEMVAAARNRIEEIETPDLIAMLGDPGIVVVDIRDIRERQRSGFIPGSFHAPRGMIEFWVDPDSPYFKDIFAQEKKFIFHCASGWRSALTVATLQDMGFAAAHLKEGFSTWENHGGAVEFPKTDASD
jgi:rhodanese-related sulfurtransferase